MSKTAKEPKWAHSFGYTSARNIRHEVYQSPETAIVKHENTPPGGKMFVQYKFEQHEFDTWADAVKASVTQVEA